MPNDTKPISSIRKAAKNTHTRYDMDIPSTLEDLKNALAKKKKLNKTPGPDGLAT